MINNISDIINVVIVLIHDFISSPAPQVLRSAAHLVCHCPILVESQSVDGISEQVHLR